MSWLHRDAMRERSLPLPGGCWKLRSIGLPMTALLHEAQLHEHGSATLRRELGHEGHAQAGGVKPQVRRVCQRSVGEVNIPKTACRAGRTVSPFRNGVEAKVRLAAFPKGSVCTCLGFTQVRRSRRCGTLH